MTSPDQHDRSAVPASGAHARHDTFLVAAHAAGDLSGASLRAVEAQIATCSACSALHDDLRAIATATQSLSSVTIPASAAGRDFRLTPEQAARLDRGRGWRRLLEPLAGSGGAWTRPLAGALTTLGLAGVLLTTVLPGIGGLASSGASQSAPEQLTVQVANPTAVAPGAAGPTAAPAPAGVPDAGGGAGAGAGAVGATSGPSTEVDAFAPDVKASAEAASGDNTGRNAASAAPGPPDQPTQETAPTYAAGQGPAQSVTGVPASTAQDGMNYEPLIEASSPSSLLAIASVVLIVLGLAIFGLRFVARRYT
ncbi:MAG: anti-sigma factor [Chloroflexota bacterium]